MMDHSYQAEGIHAYVRSGPPFVRSGAPRQKS
jgi:hypothetical protein